MTRKIRVVFTTPTLTPRVSPWQELRGLAIHLPKDEFSLTFCALRTSKSDEFVEELHDLGCETMVARFRPRAYTRRHMRSWVRDVGELRRHRFDLQHSMDFSTLPSEALASKVIAPRFTFTLRNSGSDGHLQLLRVKAAVARKVVSISPSTSAVLRGIRVPERKVVEISNGLELPLDTATQGDLPKRYLACVGGIVSLKRQRDVVAMFATIAEQVPELELLLVGDTDTQPEYVDQVRRDVSSRGLQAKVHLLGRREDAPGIMAGADAVVIASESEGLSSVMLEALAVGTPLICTDIAGARPVIDPGGCCEVFPVGQPATAAAAFLALAGDDSRRSTNIGNGRRLIEERFTAAVMAEHYARFLADACA